MFSVLQPGRTFSFRFEKGRAFLQPAHRKCLTLYFYLIDPRFGLIHVPLQTWFPMVVQVYLNGHEWLARKLDDNGVGYTKLDNVFLDLADVDRAQAFADRFASLDWSRILEELAQQVNPLRHDLLKGMQHYWVTTQCEYSTDVMFKGRTALQGLYPHLVSHSTRCFGAKEVMGFLDESWSGSSGRVHHGPARAVAPTDSRRTGQASPRGNWVEMYDKAGRVLSIETVINSPEGFRVRKSVRRHGQPTTEWVAMRKGVAYLFRYRDVSHSANSRCLDALAVVADPTARVGELDRVTRRQATADGRSARAINPLAREELQLFHAVLDGTDALRGFTNQDVRARLQDTPHLARFPDDPKRQSAKVGRLLHRLHAHGLVAKFPHSRRWRTTRLGRRLMATAIQIREINFPQLLALAA